MINICDYKKILDMISVNTLYKAVMNIKTINKENINYNSKENYIYNSAMSNVILCITLYNESKSITIETNDFDENNILDLLKSAENVISLPYKFCIRNNLINSVKDDITEDVDKETDVDINRLLYDLFKLLPLGYSSTGYIEKVNIIEMYTDDNNAVKTHIKNEYIFETTIEHINGAFVCEKYTLTKPDMHNLSNMYFNIINSLDIRRPYIPPHGKYKIVFDQNALIDIMKYITWYYSNNTLTKDDHLKLIKKYKEIFNKNIGLLNVLNRNTSKHNFVLKSDVIYDKINCIEGILIKQIFALNIVGDYLVGFTGETYKIDNGKINIVTLPLKIVQNIYTLFSNIIVSDTIYKSYNEKDTIYTNVVSEAFCSALDKYSYYKENNNG